jgi:hypothetical protein
MRTTASPSSGAPLEGGAAHRELEHDRVFHLELVEGEAHERLERPERREPEPAEAGAGAPEPHVERVLVLRERVAHVEEQDPHEPESLGDREAILAGERDEHVAADHVGLVEVVELVDLLVVEAVALATAVALERVLPLVLALAREGVDPCGREEGTRSETRGVPQDGPARSDRARREAAQLVRAEAAEEVALGEGQIEVVVDQIERAPLGVVAGRPSG